MVFCVTHFNILIMLTFTDGFCLLCLQFPLKLDVLSNMLGTASTISRFMLPTI